MFWFHYAFENVIIILEFLFKVAVVRIKWWTFRKDGQRIINLGKLEDKTIMLYLLHFLNITSDYLLPMKTMKKYLNIYKVVLAGSYHAVELLCNILLQLVQITKTMIQTSIYINISKLSDHNVHRLLLLSY